MLNIEEKYQELKNNPNVLLNCHEILYFFVDYYREKVRLENAFIPYMDSRDFDYDYYRYYKSTDEYKKNYGALENKGMNELTKLSELTDEFFERYESIIKMILDSRNNARTLLDLIDYIGHYSKEECYNEAFYQEIMAKYGISFIKDENSEEIQISSRDAVRLIESAKVRIYMFDKIIDECRMTEDNWIKLILRSSVEEKEKFLEYINGRINTFLDSADGIKEEENYESSFEKIKRNNIEM